MRATGWYDRRNVTILEGKWQDFVGSTSNHKLLEFGGFDVVYTDTFSEDYSALKEFFEQLPDILDGPEARFGFFNGLGATSGCPLLALRQVDAKGTLQMPSSTTSIPTYRNCISLTLAWMWSGPTWTCLRMATRIGGDRAGSTSICRFIGCPWRG